MPIVVRGGLRYLFHPFALSAWLTVCHDMMFDRLFNLGCLTRSFISSVFGRRSCNVQQTPSLLLRSVSFQPRDWTCVQQGQRGIGGGTKSGSLARSNCRRGRCVDHLSARGVLAACTGGQQGIFWGALPSSTNGQQASREDDSSDKAAAASRQLLCQLPRVVGGNFCAAIARPHTTIQLMRWNPSLSSWLSNAKQAGSGAALFEMAQAVSFDLDSDAFANDDFRIFHFKAINPCIGRMAGGGGQEEGLRSLC
jgi:hypothetical protein